MFSLFRKYSTNILVLLLVILLISIWLFPHFRSIFTILFLVCGLALASSPVIEKHRQAYLQGKISRRVCTRNILFDVVGIVFALILAVLLGRYFAEATTELISNEFIKLTAGIVIGLLTGLAVGIFIQQSWRRLIRISPEN